MTYKYPGTISLDAKTKAILELYRAANNMTWDEFLGGYVGYIDREYNEE